MTKLEVQLAASQDAHAEQEEELANVFKEAMGAQEQRIQELEAELHDARQPGAQPGQAEEKAKPKRWF